MLKKINIAVIGATGYTGLDLINLLSKHPKAQVVYLCATKNLGKKINYFDKRIKKKLPRITSIKNVDWRKIELVFIGQKLDPKKITKELENCLLNDHELSDWNQGNFKNTDEWPIPN